MQQRLVHRQNFEFPEAQSTVEELSVDGGNIRIRTPIGKPCDWKGYKAVRLHNLQAMAASFQENNLVIDWVNNQPLASILTCIGDGHDGIWNIIREFIPSQERREILDWFHLVENLYKVGGSMQRIHTAKEFLWNVKLMMRRRSPPKASPALLTANSSKLKISVLILKNIYTV